MSRRKQAKPQHIDSEEPASGGNGEFYARRKVGLSKKNPKLKGQSRRVSLGHADVRGGDANFGASVAL